VPAFGPLTYVNENVLAPVKVRVATWIDEQKTTLVPQEPMATEVLQETN